MIYFKDGFFLTFESIPEVFYSEVADEMAQGLIDKGLWTKTLSECNGDEVKTKAKYLKYRALKLYKNDEEEKSKLDKEIAIKKEAQRNANMKKWTWNFFIGLTKNVLLFGIPTLVGILGFKGFPVIIAFCVILSVIIKYDRKIHGKEDKFFIWIAILIIISFVFVMIFEGL